MALSVAAPSFLAPHIKQYKERVRHAKPVGKVINDQWLSATMGLCDMDDKAARELSAKSLRTFFGPDRPYLKDQTHPLRAARRFVGRRARASEGELRALSQDRRATRRARPRSISPAAPDRSPPRCGTRSTPTRWSTAASSSPAIPRPASGASPSTRKPASTSCSSSWRRRPCARQKKIVFLDLGGPPPPKPRGEGQPTGQKNTNVTKLLIANRGEIAIRIARAAADMGVPTVAVYSEDDSRSLHLRVADEFQALPGQGAAAYLNAEAVIAAATASGCDAIHPGYGFLAERGDFARMCAEAGLTFVGPDVAHLELFGDKARARIAAVAASVPVIRGLDHAVTLAEARAFFASLGPGGAMIIKALAGGGGRGTRAVLSADELDGGLPALPVRGRRRVRPCRGLRGRIHPRARHVEVQILGDQDGGIAHLGERECSIQRRFQKIVEIAPAPCAGRWASPSHHRRRGAVRETRRLHQSRHVRVPGRCLRSPGSTALRVHRGEREAAGRAHGHRGGDRRRSRAGPDPAGAGRDIEGPGAGRPGIARPRGYAIQTRVNMETIGPDGSVRPGGGTLTVYEAPNGPGVRTDGFGYAGYRTSGAFDSLLAKVIVHGAGLRGRGGAILARAQRVPAGGRRHQHPVPPQHPRASRLRRRKRPHPLGR